MSTVSKILTYRVDKRYLKAFSFRTQVFGPKMEITKAREKLAKAASARRIVGLIALSSRGECMTVDYGGRESTKEDQNGQESNLDRRGGNYDGWKHWDRMESAE